jgi:hypothetical protein
MKLHLVNASRGAYWVKAGARTFFRQPLALAGLFFMFMAAMSLLSLVPLLGNVLALTLLPGATLGLMVATQQASQGTFPKPAVLLSAFRSGQSKLRDMLILGALYAAGFLLILGITALVDGGKFARLYLFGSGISPDVLQEPDFEAALLLAMALYMPLSLLFWHAPALVHWHGISPVKSLFFSLVACLRNFWAYTVYSVVWLAAFLGMGMVVALVSVLAGNPELATAALFPGAMLMAALFFTSIYFTFQDSFEPSNGDTP